MHEHEVDPAAVAADLAPLVEGELQFDPIGRTLYASAACVYEIQPLGAVIARHADDVAAVVEYAAANGLSIVPRGAATALAGQAVGPGIVLDLSRYLTGIEAVDDERVRVEPGVVQKRLEQWLAPHGRFFPPDPSSGRMCTLGGMIANNAAGTHSVKYGTTKDFLDSIDVVLADGTRTTLTHTPRPAPDGSLAAKLEAVLEPAQAVIAEHWPETNKSSSGYNLKEAWGADFIAPEQLVCGSEGTLAVVVSAVLRTLPRPTETVAALVAVERLADVGEVINEILAWGPAGNEILDKSVLRLLDANELSALRDLPGLPDAVLLVEFDGDEREPLIEQLGRFGQAFDRPGIAVRTATTAAEQARLWKVRHATNPILNRVPGLLKPITFIEDGVVAPERLPEYIQGLTEICGRHEVQACIFGHAGNGHLHIKPLLNLREQRDVERMGAIADDACDLLHQLRGTISGEHGDGLVRTPLLRRLHGELYPVYEQVKQVFDPKGALNPGKIVTPADSRKVTDDLRFDHRTTLVPSGTVLDQPRWRLEMDKCHGCGTCRDYCPVFLATGEEAATARAKANLLRALLRGDLPTEMLYDTSFKRVMDLCVNCQLCLTECPTGVDIPALARHARAAYVERKGQSLQNRLLAESGLSSAANSAVAPLSNVVLKSDLARSAMEKIAGIDRRREMPEFHHRAFGSYQSSGWERAERRVVYFPGCYGLYNDPDGEAQAVIEVLETNQIGVKVPAGLRCCGIAKVTVGSLKEARRDAAHNLKLLRGLVNAQTPLVASASSCGLALRTDYLELLGEDARSVSDHVLDIHEYLLALHAAGGLDLETAPLDIRLAYHEPCHLKAQPTAAGSAAKLLELIPGVELVPITDSCCGIAGTFGFKSQNYELSMQMGAPLFAALEQAAPSAVATGCGTCQIQITAGTGLPVTHPVALLRKAYRSRARNGLTKV